MDGNNNIALGADNQIEARKSSITLDRIPIIPGVDDSLLRTLQLLAKFENYKSAYTCDVGYTFLSELMGCHRVTAINRVKKLIELNLVHKRPRMYKGARINNLLSVNWERVIELSEPVWERIGEHFESRKVVVSTLPRGSAHATLGYKTEGIRPKDIDTNITGTVPVPDSDTNSLPEKTPEKDSAIKCNPVHTVLSGSKKRNLETYTAMAFPDVWDTWLAGCDSLMGKELYADFKPLAPMIHTKGKYKGKLETVKQAEGRCKGQIRIFTRKVTAAGYDPVEVMRAAMDWYRDRDPDKTNAYLVPFSGEFAGDGKPERYIEHYETVQGEA